MKTQRKSFAKIIAAVGMIVLVFNFTACSDNSPMSSGEENLQSKDNMQIIEFGDDIMSLNKGEASAIVTPEDGGRLLLVQGPAFLSANGIEVSSLEESIDEDSLEIIGFGNNSGVFISLEVLPYSVKDTTKLSLTLDNNSIDMEFGPHGTVFQNPAVLNIIVFGLKLKNVNTETLDVYWDNPETGQWEKMETEQVVVSERWGFIQIRNTNIPHFSRYALAWSN